MLPLSLEGFPLVTKSFSWTLCSGSQFAFSILALTDFNSYGMFLKDVHAHYAT